jgi:galacturan 1,4-alpha-galacturonidase
LENIVRVVGRIAGHFSSYKTTNFESFTSSQFLKMKLSHFLLSSLGALASASTIASSNEFIPAGASITLPRFSSSLLARLPGFYSKPKRDNWGNRVESDRKKITIRASKDDKDDISKDFLWALKEANHGGMVYLQKGKKYVIGMKLDLTFLNDVYVKLDGELKVSTSHE